MTINEILEMIGRGDIGILGLIAFFMWKMERGLTAFLAELRTERDGRNSKLDEIHGDIAAMIRHMAGLNGKDK